MTGWLAPAGIAAAYAIGLFLVSLTSAGEFLPALFQGAWVTIQITVAAALLALAMGFLAGLGKLSRSRPRWTDAYVEVFRGTLALEQLFLGCL